MSLLVGLYARLGGLQTAGPEYLARFRGDLEKVRDRLKKLSDDLKSSFHICPQVTQRLISKQSAEEYFVVLDHDRELREKTKMKLENLTSSLVETRRVLEYLPKLIDQKPVLDRVKDLDERRSIKNLVDNCKDIQNELVEWKKSAGRSLEKIANSSLPERLGIELPVDVQESSGNRRTSEHGPATKRDKPWRPKQARGPRAAGAERRSPGAGTKAGQRRKRMERRSARAGEPPPAARSRDEELALAGLSRWARWCPTVRSGLARAARLSQPKHVDAKVIHVKALWGERKVTRRSVPYRGGTVDDKPVGSLWSLPAAPPGGFQSVKEEGFRVPGNDHVVDCERCSGRGKEPCKVCAGSGRRQCKKCGAGSDAGSCGKCENGWAACDCQSGLPKCHACDGTGKILKYEICDTSYFTETFVESTCDPGLPKRLLAPQEGRRVFHDSVFYPPETEDQKEHDRIRLEAVSKQVGPDVRAKLVERLFQESARKPLNGKERQLIRISLEVTTVSLVEFLCEPRDPARQKADWRFRVWLFGDNKKFYASGYPEKFTWKAATWFLGFAVLGAPFGYALMRLVSG